MARGEAWLGIAVLVTAVLLASAATLASPVQAQGEPEECRYDPDTGEVVCDFDPGDDGNETDDDPWWAQPSVEVGLGVVGLTGSIAGGTWAVLKTRRRRKQLREMLSRIDATYARNKADPSSGLPALSSLRESVHELHERGKLSDSQFLELEDRVGERIARLRLLHIDRSFSQLPDRLETELEHAVGDGTVSHEDVEHVAEVGEAAGVAGETMDPLVSTLADWAEADRTHLERYEAAE